MSKRRSNTALSLYRQVRVTFTQEVSGRLSCSIYAKGLNHDWTERTCLARWQVEYDEPLQSTDDVIGALIHTLREQTLPGI